MPPDAGLLLDIHSLAGRSWLLDGLMRLAVNDFLIPLSLFLIMLGLWFGSQDELQRKRNQRAVLLTVAGFSVTAVIMHLLNRTFLFKPWPRPFDTFPEVDPDLIFYPALDPSFPCHMATICFALATGILLHNRKAGIIMYFLAALASFARIYSGVHYPLDVVGGWAVGAIPSYVVYKASPLFEPLMSVFFKGLNWLCLADISKAKS